MSECCLEDREESKRAVGSKEVRSSLLGRSALGASRDKRGASRTAQCAPAVWAEDVDSGWETGRKWGPVRDSDSEPSLSLVPAAALRN